MTRGRKGTNAEEAVERERDALDETRPKHLLAEVHPLVPGPLQIESRDARAGSATAPQGTARERARSP